MTLFMIAFFALIIGAVIWLSERYFAWAKQNLAHAAAMQPKLTAKAARLIEDEDTPESVARVVFWLAAAAGCGCFVRGFVIYHYLPRFGRSDKDSASLDEAFGDVEKLPVDDRKEFFEFLAMVIAYDSYENPLQGWLFRRAIRSFFNKQTMSFQDRLIAMGTAFSILSHGKGAWRNFRI
ncbi:hypothetical protein HFP57_12605 [Parasphingopyxis algicola]|uniref:hypothetical protein n=1 Tax=Parasphingopyxis algicola TaxID=2026624 RepID=UPI0015A4EDE9|nr:hypothetical protein [Parasphingopyxis algicola]QLC25773.1 hypothetical protein HFP57_12605 [Parasphingopyxis algicola]